MFRCLLRGRCLRGELLLQLSREFFCLIFGELQLTVEYQSQLASAAGLKLRFLYGYCAASSRRQNGFEVNTSLHGQKNQVADLPVYRGTKGPSRQRVAENFVSGNVTNLGSQM